ncbi:MAG: fluoride efflux transporter CrcB [Verrucomicrobia bacterium]|nr:fluoride efflux transporter CrcB [Verrucomicrobiota bacterium]
MRHVASSAMHRWSGEGFPWGTLIVNIVGSALIGAFFGVGGDTSAVWYCLLGFCGGLTTFSTFSLQNLSLLSEGRRGAVLLNMILSVGLCLLAAVGGYLWMEGMLT